MKYLKLMRVKHYIKNITVFIPIFFAGRIFRTGDLLTGTLGFLAFCLVSSAVYIFNDIRDIEKDRNHSTKKYRPLASGSVSVKAALALMALCLLGAVSLSVVIGNITAAVLLSVYFFLNLAYSSGLKNVPIVDIVILASGFVLRIYYGGSITGIEISKWLFLVVAAGSLYLSLGKRRNELKRQTDTRDVLKYYNVSFLDKNMYVCVALANVFYALWALEFPDPVMSWSVPIFIILLMCYSLYTERDSDGDPVEVILHNKTLITIIIIYAAFVFAAMYHDKILSLFRPGGPISLSIAAAF